MVSRAFNQASTISAFDCFIASKPRSDHSTRLWTEETGIPKVREIARMPKPWFFNSNPAPIEHWFKGRPKT